VAAVSPELADAVGVALRIDPRERYPTAVEMAHALEEGSRGIEPGSGTAVVPPRSASSTTVIARDERTRVAVGVTPRQPRQGVARREPPPQTAPHSNTGRIAALLVALVIVAAAVVAIVLSIQPSGKVQLHPGGFSGDFQSVLTQLNSLIDANTS
jgi:hypothetical protein